METGGGLGFLPFGLRLETFLRGMETGATLIGVVVVTIP